MMIERAKKRWRSIDPTQHKNKENAHAWHDPITTHVRIVEEILLIQVRIIRHKPTRRKEGEFWFLPCAEKSEAAKRDRREPTKRGPRSIDAHEQEKGTTRVCFRASDRSTERASGLGTTTFCRRRCRRRCRLRRRRREGGWAEFRFVFIRLWLFRLVEKLLLASCNKTHLSLPPPFLLFILQITLGFCAAVLIHPSKLLLLLLLLLPGSSIWVCSSLREYAWALAFS
jgi:hypothetical protein